MGKIHAGDIRDPNTKAGKLFEVMTTRPGEWWDAAELQERIGISTAISTRISEVRDQSEALGWQVPKCKRTNNRSYYMILRIAIEGEQMEMRRDGVAA